MNDRFVMLVRREFWEHRALWIAPAGGRSAAAGRLRSSASSASARASDRHWRRSRRCRRRSSRRSAYAFMMMLAMVSAIVVAAYLLDCLYAERKDRSILFWKSLPVSDARTVLVKFGVGDARRAARRLPARRS